MDEKNPLADSGQKPGRDAVKKETPDGGDVPIARSAPSSFTPPVPPPSPKQPVGGMPKVPVVPTGDDKKEPLSPAMPAPSPAKDFAPEATPFSAPIGGAQPSETDSSSAPAHPWPNAVPPVPPTSPTPMDNATPPVTPPPSAPSPSNVILRTMGSDNEGMKKSGGAVPEPKPFSSPLIANTGDGRFTGPDTQSPSAPQEISVGKKKWGSFIILITSLTVIAGVLGAVGYFIVWPILFPEPLDALPAQPAQQQPPPPAQTTPPDQQQQPPPPAQTEEAPNEAIPHVSLFISGPSLASGSIDVPEQPTAASLRALMQSASQLEGEERTAANGAMREILFTKGTAPAAFSLIASTLINELTFATIDVLFESDFTGFVYYDENGVWPGYVAKLKDTATEATAQNQIAAMEASSDVVNFYLQNPDGAATFKDGVLGARPVRYLTFTTPGATLEYGWFNKHLVISTSFEGMKKAAESLGF